MLLWFNVRLISMAVYRGGGPEVCVLLLSALWSHCLPLCSFTCGGKYAKITMTSEGQNKLWCIRLHEQSESNICAACFWVKRGTVLIYMPAARVVMFLVSQSSSIHSNSCSKQTHLCFCSDWVWAAYVYLRTQHAPIIFPLSLQFSVKIKALWFNVWKWRI